MRLSDHRLSLARIDNGVWWNFATNSTCADNKPHATDACFLVVPYVGGAFDVEFSTLCRPYAELMRKGDLPEDVRRDLVGRAHARAVLRGWANLEDDDGKPLPWSEDKATEIMADRRWLVLSTFVCRAANQHAAALAKEEEQAKGN